MHQCLSVWLLSSLRLLLLYAQFAVFHSYLASSIIHTLPGKDSGAKDKRNINYNQFYLPHFPEHPCVNQYLCRLWSPWVLPSVDRWWFFEAVKAQRDTCHDSLHNSRRLDSRMILFLWTPCSGNFCMGSGSLASRTWEPMQLMNK